MRLALLAFLVAVGVAPAADPPKLDALLNKLENPADDGERREASDALVALGKDAAPAIPKLLELYNSPKLDGQRDLVARVFVAMGDAAKPVVADLIEQVDDGGPPQRERGVILLQALGPVAKDAIPILRKEVRRHYSAGARAVDALLAVEPDMSKETTGDIVHAMSATPSYYDAGSLAKKRWAFDPVWDAALRERTRPSGVPLVHSPEVVREAILSTRAEARASVPYLKLILLAVDRRAKCAELNELESQRVIERAIEEGRLKGIPYYAMRLHAFRPMIVNGDDEALRRDRILASLALAHFDGSVEAVAPLREVLVTGWEGDGNKLYKLYHDWYGPTGPTAVAEALGKIGPAAKAALPELRAKLDKAKMDDEKQVYRAAIKAIEGKK